MIAVHRRSDLVAHVGQEFRLGVGGLLGLDLGPIELAHELREVRGMLGLGFARQFELARVCFEAVVGVPGLGDVARGGVDRPLVRVRHRRPRQPAVRAVGREVAILESQDRLACPDMVGGGHRRGAVVGVHALQVRRGTQFRDREPENALPRLIEPFEVAVEACDAQQVAREREEAIELLLGAAPLHELADLTADRGEHLEQRGVGLPDLAAEELHHGDHVVADDDGEAEGAVQAFHRGRGRAGEVPVEEYVRDERGLCGRPDPAGQPDAALERGRPAMRIEAGKRRAWRVPDLDASEAVGMRIDLPECPVLPPERRADGLEDPWRRVGQASCLRQHARRRGLRREALRSLGL